VREYGDEVGREFIDKVFRIFIKVLEKRGFTMTLEDISLPNEAEAEIKRLFNETFEKVQELINR
jgi:DNA-directed RNA polymerase subunit A'